MSAPDAIAERVLEQLAELIKPERPALLDRAGVARALDVSLATLDRLRGEGMPELRIGEAPRFELDRVLEWLRSRGPGVAKTSDEVEKPAAPRAKRRGTAG